MYEGNSIVDYLRSLGQPTDYASRAKLAASKGIQGYSGSAQQNTQLLNMIRGGATPQPQTPQTTPQATPQPRQTAQPQQQVPQSSGPTSASQLVSMGYQGYQGWGDAEAVADFKATGGQGKGGPTSSGGGTGIGAGFLNAPTINLPELYESLYANSGIKDIEGQLSEKTRQYNEAVAKIKDNPYLSEATMTGRLRKLDEKFSADTAAIRGDVATRKADIETQLNLQTKQFDIQSEQAQLALNQFNSLLDSGALNNASGEDIANITRATGLSSSVIQSAINQKIQSGYTTTTKTFDDGVEEGFTIYTLDPMGNIINQTRQVTGKSNKSSGGQYSDDPVVSKFIESMMQNQSIQEGWDQIGTEESGQYGMSTNEGPVYYQF